MVAQKKYIRLTICQVTSANSHVFTLSPCFGLWILHSSDFPLRNMLATNARSRLYCTKPQKTDSCIKSTSPPTVLWFLEVGKEHERTFWLTLLFAFNDTFFFLCLIIWKFIKVIFLWSVLWKYRIVDKELSTWESFAISSITINEMKFE